mmetsp:Transcript_50391/g.151765  ORF Transcript_50391/g.151765 Transcript_50391/m.151765 type:complete len:80 (+) Transcript_50391:1423-1662(+)
MAPCIRGLVLWTMAKKAVKESVDLCLAHCVDLGRTTKQTHPQAERGYVHHRHCHIDFGKKLEGKTRRRRKKRFEYLYPP